LGGVFGIVGGAGLIVLFLGDRPARGAAQGSRHTLTEAKRRQRDSQKELKDLEPRLSFSPKLPTSVLLSILGQIWKRAGERCVCEARVEVCSGDGEGAGHVKTKLLSVAAPPT